MIDFNNDALPLVARTLEPLIGEDIAIDGCLMDGRNYTHGTLVAVLPADDGAQIDVEEYGTGQILRLHAPQEAHRVRVCR